MKYLNLINNKFVEPETKLYFDNINPALNTDIIGEFPISNLTDVNKAVAASKKAFKIWKNMPAPKRGDILRIAGDLFTKRKDELAKIMTREMGKPVFETRGDVQEAIDTCYYAATETRRLFGFNAPSEMNEKMNLSFRMPIGVCGIITAWNFPIAVPSWKIIPALAAGNTVIFKPSEESPLSAHIFGEILLEAGIPEGVFNIVYGLGETGNYLVEHPDVNLIAFTGSTSVGKLIASKCGQFNKKVSLEMGGKNVMIVMDDADIDLAVNGCLWGAYGTTGQRCTATSRVLLHKSISKEFISKMKKEVSKLKLGNGLELETNVGPVINQKSVDKISTYFEIAKEENLKLEFGGKRAKIENGFFIEPTLYSKVSPNSRLFQEEIFGPVLVSTEFEILEEAINLANNTTYGLSSSIFTKDIRNSWLAVNNLETGISYVNAPTIGAEAHMPFGGVKGTGNGHREGGWTAFDIFTEWKTVYIDYSGKLQRAQIDNY